MKIGQIELTSVKIEDQINHATQIDLKGQSIAIIGANGVGKSSFLNALKNSLNGNFGIETPYLAILQLELPTDFDITSSENDDSGLLKEIIKNIGRSDLGYDLLVSKYVARTLTLSDIHEVLLNKWKWALKEYEDEWKQQVYLESNSKEKDQWGQQSLIGNEVAHVYSIISLPIGEATFHENPSEIVRSEKVKSDNRIESLLRFLSSNKYVLIQFSGSRANGWECFHQFSVPIETAQEDPNVRYLVEEFIWPYKLEEIQHHRGQWGKSKRDWYDRYYSSQDLGQPIRIRFTENSVEFELSIGMITNIVGFNIIDPDFLDFSELKQNMLRCLHFNSKYNSGTEEQKQLLLDPFFNKNRRVVFRILNDDASFNRNATVQEFSDIQTEADKFSSLATNILHSIMPTGLTIRIDVNRKEHWLTEGITTLAFYDGYTNIDFQNLSFGQQRWVKLALHLATIDSSVPRILFIDEPEKGLQRSLEELVMEGLTRFLDSQVCAITLSTHSAAIIKDCDSSIKISQQVDGGRNLAPLPSSIYTHLEELQISIEEFLQSQRLIVVTEGDHDTALLNGFYGHKLRKNGIELITSSGLNSWSGFVDSHFFLTYAKKIVFVSDSLNWETLENFIQMSRESYLREKISKEQLWSEVNQQLDSWVREKWGRNQSNPFANLVISAITSKTRKVFFYSTGDWDCLYWIGPRALGIREGITFEKLRDQALISIRKPENSGVSLGVLFKKEIVRELKKRNISQGLSVRRLEQIAMEMSLTNQIPNSVQKMFQYFVKVADL